jgi:CRP-like cAMP-binding protein
MQLKEFTAGRYDDDYILICNPENRKQELFREDEFEIVKFIKKNEQESLLGLLLPNIGVAKKDHIVVCLNVMRKLKRMQLVDPSTITGKNLTSETRTFELETKKIKVEILGLQSLAAFVFKIFEKIFSWMGASLFLFLVLISASLGFAFFPFSAVEGAFQYEGVSYWKLVLTLYGTLTLALSLRSLVQAAFIRSLKRETFYHGISLFFPFFILHADKKEINLEGFRARIQMALLGLLAPLALSSVFVGLHLLGWISLSTTYFAFSSCVIAFLLLACPFFPADGADIIHVLFLRDELKERISKGLREIFRTKGSLSREMLVAVIISFVWLLGWLDSLRAFWETISVQVSNDIFSPYALDRTIGAGLVMVAILSLVLMPAGIFLFGAFRDRFSYKKKKIHIQKDRLKDSLSFEERMAALEKIPLFAYLNNQERLILLNEMKPMFFPHREFLMHQGEVGKEFFVLVKGSANAYYTDIHGRNYLLADLGEGDAFGEIALIDDVPRTASIVSDGGCIVLVLKKDGFERFAQTLGSPDRVKTMIRLTSFFRRHPLFSKLGVKDQAQLIDSFQFQTITIGEEVPNGEDNFYVIYSGKIRLDTGDDSADVNLTSDDCFGYANALHANYFALEGAGLLSVKTEEFYSLIWEKLVERPELFL